ncbi:alpha/beta hydrolase fold protein [Atractiella rhizophila]|nr:alpha/beta hydrolase fold protein [Atractiella rhizophila]
MAPVTTVHRVPVSPDTEVFYRKAGNPSNPTFLLLHGFPTSSHQYRHLIGILAEKYYVVAPDLPGFGFTTVPSSYVYTFDALAETIGTFLQKLEINKFLLYIFDYGAPVGLRIALKRPGDVLGIVTQNGNAYNEGLSEFWDSLKPLWETNGAEVREALGKKLTAFETTKYQYEQGVPSALVSTIQPEAYWLDQALMERPGQEKIQLDLFYDYQNNLKLYPKFHDYFRSSNVPILAVWGNGDPFFLPPGAEAYKKDSKNVEVKLLETGHFALETHAEEIGQEILGFTTKYGL